MRGWGWADVEVSVAIGRSITNEILKGKAGLLVIAKDSTDVLFVSGN